MEAQVQSAVEIALNPEAEYTLKQQVSTRAGFTTNLQGTRVCSPGQGLA